MSSNNETGKLNTPLKSVILLCQKVDANTRDEIARGVIQRNEYMELADRLNADIWSYNDVATSENTLVKLAARLGEKYGLTALAFLNRKKFDAIYANGEFIGVPLGAICALFGYWNKITLLVHNCGTPTRRVLLSIIPKIVWRQVLCLSNEQTRILTEDLGFKEAKVKRYNQWLDTQYFDPSLAVDNPETKNSYVFSCGKENRDYDTLVRATKKLPFKFRILASGWDQSAAYNNADRLAGSNIEALKGGIPASELRNLYHNARFVVVPLNSVTYAAGVTGICEAMAMGKAVIISASKGVLEYVKEGVSGYIVPVGDDLALAKAIETLWNNPELCQKMGEENRRRAVSDLAVERYAEDVATLFASYSK